MSLAAASRYARALADLVLAPNSGVAPDEALAQVRTIEAALQQSAELRAALMSPAVPMARKRAVARGLAEKLELARTVRNFLLVVIDHRRVTLLGSIAGALEKTLDDRLGRVLATVTSAAPLDDRQRSKIERRLVERTGKQVRFEFAQNPELIGGLSVKIGSTIYDGSVRGRLTALRSKMASST
jgi:F-type H+-transporting ATPase subunit delta